MDYSGYPTTRLDRTTPPAAYTLLSMTTESTVPRIAYFRLRQAHHTPYPMTWLAGSIGSPYPLAGSVLRVSQIRPTAILQCSIILKPLYPYSYMGTRASVCSLLSTCIGSMMLLASCSQCMFIHYINMPMHHGIMMHRHVDVAAHDVAELVWC